MIPWFNAGHLNPVAIITNTPHPFDNAAQVASWTATPAEAPGAIPAAIVVSGRLFYYDSGDVISAHDGQWVMVSADGRRYKAGDVEQAYSIQSKTVVTPPALNSSSYKKTWIVGPAATGAWAGHDGELAVSTARGWVFLTAKTGHVVYVADQAVFYHMASGGWTLGLGAPSVGAVDSPSLAWPWGLLAESRTLNTPPTGATRYAYIIGSSPTGAWAGRSNQVAIGPLNGWSYIQPAEGAEVWCRAENRYLRFVSGAWTADAGTLPSIRRVANDAALTLAGNSYAYNPGVAPTTSNTADGGLSITHAARAAGNLIRIRVRFQVNLAAEATGTVALFVDASASAAQWVGVTAQIGSDTFVMEFHITTADAVAHAYSIRFGAGIALPSHRFLTVEELSILT